ncbi:MAG TPA: hypothetical protein VL485_15410, partial [Ktedonobacteraceae bacterium]|nr:hypothetical protein [Ktedonobacteraceae bacterium]
WGLAGRDKPLPLPVIEGKRAGGETQIPRDVIDAFGFPLQVGDAVYPNTVQISAMANENKLDSSNF